MKYDVAHILTSLKTVHVRDKRTRCYTYETTYKWDDKERESFI